MTIKQTDYVAPSRATPDLAAADLAGIRAVATADDAIRVFERLHESRAGGGCRRASGGPGGVYANANGWRAGMSIRKRRYCAPTRETRDLAEADLAEIRAAANKNDAIRVVRRLKESCVQVGGV